MPGTPLDGLDMPALERFFAAHVPGYAGGLAWSGGPRTQLAGSCKTQAAWI